MTWGMVAVAGVTAASSFISSSSAARGAAKSASAASRTENEAIARQNINTMVRYHYRAGLLNMQLGQARKQATQEGFNQTVMAQQALGAATANQAATGTVGASADAVITDINMKLGEAQAQGREDFETTLTNYNNELGALEENMRGDVQYERKYKYEGPSTGQMLGGALLAGATSFIGNYASRKMSLGLGPSAGATQASLGSGVRGSIQPNLGRWS